MKRSSDGDPVDAAHPAICFHREVLTNVQWSGIRRDFLTALEAAPQLRFREPKKLWRHSQEALGKWVLSQVARDTRPDGGDVCHFFPTAAMLAALPGGTSYDEQLIRDFTLKCDDSSNPAVVAGIRQVLDEFALSQRCEAAAVAIQSELAATPPSSLYAPSVRIISADDHASRNAAQKRMSGAIVEIRVKWPPRVPTEGRRGCPPVSIPLAAYRKLEMCYRHFAERDECDRYARLDSSTRFALRAGALALRYEGCLATGALQLCADTRLKQHLHAAGYHVMDLCASPINAYMAAPRAGSYSANPESNSSHNIKENSEADTSSDAKKGNGDCADAGASSSSSLVTENVPNHFCSAFPDTDRYFGSLGSALRFDPAAAFHSRTVNPGRQPLLLTLDVPYDEDLCERLFMKLIDDMAQVEEKTDSAGKEKTPLFIADYVLVLPLWWNVPMQRRKFLFDAATETPSSNTTSTADEESKLNKVIAERCAMLKEGYQVPYMWPERLAEAAGERWVSFDGVFLGGSYEYFCTATNRWLRGVTATEVIGLAQPSRGRAENALTAEKSGGGADPLALEQLLAQFYDRQ